MKELSGFTYPVTMSLLSTKNIEISFKLRFLCEIKLVFGPCSKEAAWHAEACSTRTARTLIRLDVGMFGKLALCRFVCSVQSLPEVL